MGIALDAETRVATPHLNHRLRYGAFGCGLGFLAGALLQIPSTGLSGTAYLFTAATAFIGYTLGRVVAIAKDAVRRQVGPIRLSTLSPRSRRDHLRPPFRHVQSGCAAAGVVTAVVAGPLPATGTVDRSAGAFGAGAGLLVAGWAGLAWWLQRALLHLPARVDDPTYLVAHDVALAIGLDDPARLTLSITGLTAFACVWWPDPGSFLRFLLVLVGIRNSRLIDNPYGREKRLAIARSLDPRQVDP